MYFFCIILWCCKGSKSQRQENSAYLSSCLQAHFLAVPGAAGHRGGLPKGVALALSLESPRSWTHPVSVLGWNVSNSSSFQTTSWKWRMFGSCLFDHGEMLPWLTWENPKYDISKLGADIFGVCSDVSNYSLPKNWFLFGNNVQNTKICCLCLVCKALEQTDFHLFFMFLN